MTARLLSGKSFASVTFIVLKQIDHVKHTIVHVSTDKNQLQKRTMKE